jgi:hypothetical protein
MGEITTATLVAVPTIAGAVSADVAAAKAEVVTVKSGIVTLFKAYWLPAASLLVGFIAGKIL